MRKLFFTLFSAFALLAVSCTFDDSSLSGRIDNLESRVAALEQLCNQMNTNITSLQTIVGALQNNDYVTNIAPITEGNKTIGYTISFSKSNSITIYLGGDASALQIGVKQHSDGLYYWTLGGEWLIDDSGNKVKAQGADGDNGNTPKLKIENDYWYISYDNGETWSEVVKATSDEGDSMFEEISYDDYCIYITLLDGTCIEIPRFKMHVNEIWYTSSDGRVITPYNKDAFGVNIVSNVYENGKGVITFDSNVTKIGYQAFYNCETLSSIILPDGITSIGENAFYGCKYLPNITLPNNVTTIGVSAFRNCDSFKSFDIPNGVTKIDNQALSSCDSLMLINIPNSVTEIGYYAFGGNKSLPSITIPNSVTSISNSAFSECRSLTSITIPNSVTTIGYAAFRECESLTSVTIPNSVTSIGEYAFAYCKSLQNITIPNSVTSIGNYAFENCISFTSVTIPSSVTSFGDGVFAGCDAAVYYEGYMSADNRCVIVDGVLKAFISDGITSYTIPNNVTAIGAGVFSGCESLTSVTIPNSVTSIGDSAFEGCTSLANIIIPSSVQTIKFGAFRDCTSLSSVTISNGVTTIENVAFAGCKAITNITIPDSVTTIGDWVFDGCTSLTTATISNSLISIGNGAFRGCPYLTAFYGSRASSDNRCLIVDGKLVAFASVGLTTYDIPSSVTSIGNYAFSGCQTLEYVNIPNSVTSIDGLMFEGCASLLSVTIPDGVTLNSNTLCYDCPSLTTITFPESIYAFYPSYVYKCPSLTAIYIKATTPPWCSMDKFYGCDSLYKIYVPASSVNAYKNASGWKNHADIIEGYDFSN